ncbi:TPA: hypothetical protein ACGUVR_004556 [Vibrio vulnificus]
MKQNIIQDFRRSSSFSDSEVKLFQQLAKSTLKYSTGIFVDETHGTTSNVEYISIRGVKERCEISDLLIVTVDPSSQYARATFWQAKKETKPQWIKNVGSQNISDGCFDFKCQFNQWELLSCRPDIAGVGAFSPPKTLLSSSHSPSIGSYGVFYESGSNLEVNYSVAEFITCTSLPKVNSRVTKAQPRMAINNKYAKYSIGFEEKIVCKNLDSFIEALLNFEIGVVLNKSKQEDIWLLKYVKAQVKASKNVIYGNDDISIDQLLPDIPDNEFQEYDDSYASGGISILIVSARP